MAEKQVKLDGSQECAHSSQEDFNIGQSYRLTRKGLYDISTPLVQLNVADRLVQQHHFKNDSIHTILSEKYKYVNPT